MYYFILLLAVIMFTAQFGFTKIYGEKAEQKTIGTLIMLTIISIIGTVLYIFVGGFKIYLSPALLFWSAMFAVIMIPYYVLGIKVLKLGSMAIYSMFMMLGGMLLPFVYGIFLKEKITVSKITGCVILCLSIALQALSQKRNENKNEQHSKSTLFIILCIIIFIINGLTGVIAKAYQQTDKSPDEISFTVVSCFFTAMLSILFLLPRFFKSPKEIISEIKFSFKPIIFLYIAAIGVATHTGNFLHLKAAAKLPASVQFPMVSGGVIVFSAIASYFFFREKISKTELFYILGAFISTLLFAF